LKKEAADKLHRVRPETLAQAAAFSGLIRRHVSIIAAFVRLSGRKMMFHVEHRNRRGFVMDLLARYVELLLEETRSSISPAQRTLNSAGNRDQIESGSLCFRCSRGTVVDIGCGGGITGTGTGIYAIPG
jgi:hypothetical protein